MQCSVFTWEWVESILAATRRGGARITYTQAVELVGREGIAHAALAKTAFASRIDRDILTHGVDLPPFTTFDPLDRALDVFNPEWVDGIMADVLEQGMRGVWWDRRRDAAEILGYLHSLSMTTRTTDAGILRSLQSAAGSAAEAQGQLFTWQWLDQNGLWHAATDLEARSAAASRWYDASLDAFSIECKDWGIPREAYVQRFVQGTSGEQIIRDLAQSPLDSTLWIFSERMTIPREEFYDAWFDALVRQTFDHHRQHPTLGPLIAAAEANWGTLRTRGIASRIVIHDPAAAAALARGETVADSLLHSDVQAILRSARGDAAR